MQRKSGAAEVLGDDDLARDRPKPGRPIDASARADANASDVEELFFSSHSLKPVELEVPLTPPTPQPDGARRAMWVTLGLLALGAIGFPLTLLYTHVIMPVPVTTGHHGPVMPVPSAYRTTLASSPSPTTVAALQKTKLTENTLTATSVETVSTGPIATHPRKPLAEAATPPAAQRELATTTALPPAVTSVTQGTPVALSNPSNARAESNAGTGSAARHKRAPLRTSRRADRKSTGRVSPAIPEHLERAMGLLNSGKFASAERLARKATRSNPRLGEAWLVLGAARDAQGKTKAAAAAYRKCGARAKGSAARACRTLANGRY